MNYETKTYNVKYIVGGGRDSNVPIEFISEPELDTGPARTGRRLQVKYANTVPNQEDGTPRQSENVRVENAKESYRMKRKFKPLCILATLSDEGTQKSLNEFLSLFSANCSGIYSPDVTHLVVQTDAKKVVSQRTMKYLKSMTGDLKYLVTVTENLIVLTIALYQSFIFSWEMDCVFYLD